MIKDRTKDNILFSCTGQARKDYEPFVEDHALSFILNGEMIINDGVVETKFKIGEMGFISKNQLLKTQKIPQDNKPFMGISIYASLADLLTRSCGACFSNSSWLKGLRSAIVITMNF